MMRWTPHAVTLRQMQYAVSVADTLSFRRAAERCHVSQPSLSAQVAQMESALGVRLFERHNRRVLVTETGRAILDRARVLLREADDLVETARQAGDPLRGTLRIGVIPTISPYLLPAVSRALRTAYRGLRIVWVEDKTAVLARALKAGELDAAVLALEAEIGDVERAVIARDAFVLATPSDDALGATERPVRQSELRGKSVLLLDDGHCFRDQALAVCAKAGTSEVDFRATSLSTLTQMVASGAGVTLLPELSLPTEARRAPVRVRRFSSPVPHRTIALVWRKRSALAPALEKIAATMRGAYPRPAGPATARR